jgi:UDP-glucose 4-epimerase
MRIYITGIAGFIGSHLAERLLLEGHEVAGIDNLLTGARENVPAGVPWYVGDVAESLYVDSPIDVIYHLAASFSTDEWERDVRTNVLGTINAVRAAKARGARIVYPQTSLCYGLHPDAYPIPVDAPLRPEGSYAVSKTAGEAYVRDSGVDHVSLRLANTYGPRQISGPLPAFFKRISEGQPCTVVDSRRDFIYVDDVVEMMVRAITAPPGMYHVATKHDRPISEVYRVVAEAMGVAVPDPVITPRGADDAPTIKLDKLETERLLGWHARVGFREGVGRTVAWYAEHGVRGLFSHLSMKG